MKVLINRSYGGFGLSWAVADELGVACEEPEDRQYRADNTIAVALGLDEYATEFRTDPRIIAAVEKIGCKAASYASSDLTIVEIPDDVQWYIDEYDSNEIIRECHRTWR